MNVFEHPLQKNKWQLITLSVGMAYMGSEIHLLKVRCNISILVRLQSAMRGYQPVGKC